MKSRPTDKQLLDWFGAHTNFELTQSHDVEDEPEWQVWEVTGNVNDREWDPVGAPDPDVRVAIANAMKAHKRCHRCPVRKRKVKAK